MSSKQSAPGFSRKPSDAARRSTKRGDASVCSPINFSFPSASKPTTHPFRSPAFEPVRPTTPSITMHNPKLAPSYDPKLANGAQMLVLPASNRGDHCEPLVFYSVTGVQPVMPAGMDPYASSGDWVPKKGKSRCK